jgi:hypothetical protein
MERDILFVVKNNFYIGAYGNAIAEASDLEGLTEQEETDKAAFVYRSYIALSNADVRGAAAGAGGGRRRPAAAAAAGSGGRRVA